MNAGCTRLCLLEKHRTLFLRTMDCVGRYLHFFAQACFHLQPGSAVPVPVRQLGSFLPRKRAPKSRAEASKPEAQRRLAAKARAAAKEGSADHRSANAAVAWLGPDSEQDAG